MKRRYIMGFLLALTMTVALFTVTSLGGRRPFRDITAARVASATVELLPPGETLELDRVGIGQLADSLRRTVIYHKDDSFRDHTGRAVIYTLHLIDDSQLTITAYDPFLVLNGKGYLADNSSCEALYSLGEHLFQERGIGG